MVVIIPPMTRRWTFGVVSLALLTTLAVPSSGLAGETIVAPAQETGPVVNASVGGGWTQVGFRNGQEAVVSAPSFEGALAFGYRVGAFDAGATLGLVQTTSLRDVGPHDPTPFTPQSMTLTHAGGFVPWHPAGLPSLAVRARAEIGYAWLPEVPAYCLTCQAIIATRTVLGGLGGAGVSYAWLWSGRVSGIAALDAYAGLLRGDAPLQIVPRGIVASIGICRR
jgi:hypothetical protein